RFAAGEWVDELDGIAGLFDQPDGRLLLVGRVGHLHRDLPRLGGRVDRVRALVDFLAGPVGDGQFFAVEPERDALELVFGDRLAFGFARGGDVGAVEAGLVVGHAVLVLSLVLPEGRDGEPGDRQHDQRARQEHVEPSSGWAKPGATGATAGRRRRNGRFRST